VRHIHAIVICLPGNQAIIMSNGEEWCSYVLEDGEIKKVKAYLENPVPSENYLGLQDLGISLETLMKDTNFSKAPTTEWYALHMCVRDERKWTHERLAWGLNRKRSDMYKLQYNITSDIMEVRREAIEKGKTSDMAALPLGNIDSVFQKAYQNMDPIFFNTTVPASWYVEAQHRFITACKSSAISMLARGFYDQKSQQLTQAGKDNWDALSRSFDLSKDSIQPSFALVKELCEGMPPEETFSSHIQRMPNEILGMILDHVLDPQVLRQESDLVLTSKWLRDNARDWSSHQTVTIRASHWPKNPPRRYHDDQLPIEWLQSLKKVRFDFDGVSFPDRKKIHPVLEQLAEIWRKKNDLRSLVLPVGPDMKYLLQQEPQVELDPIQKGIFAPLLNIPGIEPEYTADFGAPVDASGFNTLCTLVRPGHEAFEKSLRLVLGKAQVSINKKCGKYDSTPLHVSVCSFNTNSTELLLSVSGIDVNVQDGNGNTAFDCGMVGGGLGCAILLTRHKGFRATEQNFVNVVNRGRNSRVILALCDAYGGVPPRFLDDPSIRQVLHDAGRLS
jgi:hypothetical protein